MHGDRLRALADKYSAAADDVRNTQSRLKASIENNASDWKGHRRQKFDNEFQDVITAFGRYASELSQASSEFRQAAIRVDEIERQVIEDKE